MFMAGIIVVLGRDGRDPDDSLTMTIDVSSNSARHFCQETPLRITGYDAARHAVPTGGPRDA